MAKLLFLLFFVFVPLANAADSPALTFEDAIGAPHIRQKRASRISGSGITCYKTEHDCKQNCDKKCYYFDYCNHQYGPYWACSPDLALILGVTFGVLALILIVSCVLCFCCSCCCFARMLKRRKERRAQARVVAPPPGHFVQPTATYPSGQPVTAYGGQQMYNYPPPTYQGAAYPMQQYQPQSGPDYPLKQ